MRSPIQVGLLGTAFVIGLGVLAQAAGTSAKVTETTSTRCIASDGLPDHATGRFPNRGNPHTMRAQSLKVCLPLNPVKGNTARNVQTVGIATNGVIIRPGTADYYDARSPRGHSRNRASGWNLDGMGAREMLGLDSQNAHVDKRGLYHYHGMPPALDHLDGNSLVGWAADGFEIHYAGDTARPSWQLKTGTRASAPGGRYDGTYNEDFKFVAGSGNLDKCNGGMVNGRYVYFATDAYPYFPRCLYGTKITRIK